MAVGLSDFSQLHVDRKACGMQTVWFVAPLLVLGWVWTLHGAPVLSNALHPTQENFNLTRYLGKWYELAVVSSCPVYMQRHKAEPSITVLPLSYNTSGDKVSMTSTTLRNGTCKQMAAEYSLTNTSGRFSYVTRFAADVDLFVVKTNYNQDAMLVLLSTERPINKTSITVKLYGRTGKVRSAVLEDFKTLVREHGLSPDSIIIKQNKGECAPAR